MLLADFEDLLDRHGGDLDRWPVVDRGAALALVAASPQARNALATMTELEGILRKGPCLGNDDGVDTIVARATRHRQRSRASIVAARAGWAAAAAAVLALGIFVGGETTSSELASPDRVVAAAFDAGSVADVD